MGIGPDIDSPPIVRARDYGLSEDQIVVDSFVGRRVWVADRDEDSPRLVPWPDESVRAEAP
jgi:hypothetical protein